jgi:hypothetical protein
MRRRTRRPATQNLPFNDSLEHLQHNVPPHRSLILPYLPYNSLTSACLNSQQPLPRARKPAVRAERAYGHEPIRRKRQLRPVQRLGRRSSLFRQLRCRTRSRNRDGGAVLGILGHDCSLSRARDPFTVCTIEPSTWRNHFFFHGLRGWPCESCLT